MSVTDGRTPFDILEDRMSDAIDDVMAESFVFRPVYRPTDVNVRPITDPDRSDRGVVGVFDARTRIVASQPGSRISKGGLELSSPTPNVSIDSRQFDSSEHPRRSDQLLRVATGVLYEISNVADDGQGRYALDLKRLNQAVAA